MKDNRIQIGKTYNQRETLLRTIAIKDGYALMECQHSGKVIQYIVSDGLYIEENDDLHWLGNGRYYTCFGGDAVSAADALRKAMVSLMNMGKVYVLTMDTEDQAGPFVFRTHKLALAALQKELDKNQSIQKVAAEILATPLTAEFYIEHAAYFNERMMDTYAIDELPVIDEDKS